MVHQFGSQSQPKMQNHFYMINKDYYTQKYTLIADAHTCNVMKYVVYISLKLS